MEFLLTAFVVVSYIICCMLAYGLMFGSVYKEIFPHNVRIGTVFLLSIGGPISLGWIIFWSFTNRCPLHLAFWPVPKRNIIQSGADEDEAKRWIEENEMPYYFCGFGPSAFSYGSKASLYGFRSSDHAAAFKIMFG